MAKSEEKLSIAVVKESEKDKERRLKKERDEREYKEKLANPNAVWNVKWHMLVPVNINNKELPALFLHCA